MISYHCQEDNFTRGVYALAENFYISKLLDRYGSVLTEKQQRILDSYYNCDLSLSEIAENESITRQGASDFVRRTEAQLIEFEKKLSFCKKIDTLKEILEDVIQSKEDISKLADFIETI